MKTQPILFEATVRAFRDLTETASDGTATRARVLARAGRRAARRAALRRFTPPLATALLILCAGSVAWTTGARRWRPSPAAPLDGDDAVTSLPSRRELPRRVIPSVICGADPPREAASGAAEARAYGRAHRAHFVDDAPGRALAAWDAYLGAYPRGVFAPEARYNRALCLIRLERFAEAARALRPFTKGRLEGYRREEARMLLDWLQDHAEADRDAGVRASRR